LPARAMRRTRPVPATYHRPVALIAYLDDFLTTHTSPTQQDPTDYLGIAGAARRRTQASRDALDFLSMVLAQRCSGAFMPACLPGGRAPSYKTFTHGTAQAPVLPTFRQNSCPYAGIAAAPPAHRTPAMCARTALCGAWAAPRWLLPTLHFTVADSCGAAKLAYLCGMTRELAAHGAISPPSLLFLMSLPTCHSKHGELGPARIAAPKKAGRWRRALNGEDGAGRV